MSKTIEKEPGEVLKDVLGFAVEDAFYTEMITNLDPVHSRKITYCKKVNPVSDEETQEVKEYEALRQVKAWLTDCGYTVGQQQADAPIGFADKEYDSVSKWKGIGKDEFSLLSGVVVGYPNMRSGDIYVLFFTNDIYDK